MTSTGSSTLIAAIEATWTTIQQHHPDVPHVIVTLGAGTRRDGLKLGHFATNRWTTGHDRIHELFIGGEGLTKPWLVQRAGDELRDVVSTHRTVL
ncbi:hypothetical protein [Glaciihabitans sp. dw_435]|uniref:hypothetical protein n=1 Tax=Glaciihabitans sp. dw_435 TaxID=2720081 RepID=UPI0021043736|nr:hypothetical protein [Glaciihabitans sp. dw_435]